MSIIELTQWEKSHWKNCKRWTLKGAICYAFRVLQTDSKEMGPDSAIQRKQSLHIVTQNYSEKKEIRKFEEKKIEKRTLLKGVTFANLDDQL